MTEEKDLRKEVNFLKEEVRGLKQQLHNMSLAKPTNIKVKEMNVKCLKIKL